MEDKIITGSMLSNLNHYLLLRDYTFFCDFASDYQKVYFKIAYEMRGCTVTVSVNEKSKKIISDFFKGEGIQIKFIDDDSAFVNVGVSKYADITQSISNNRFGKLDEEDITD